MSEGNPPLTLSQIIDMAKAGEQVPNLDLIYAVCALESLNTFGFRALGCAAEREWKQSLPNSLGSAQHQHAVQFRRIKAALEQAPILWLGWENDPFNPDYQKRRKASLRLFEKVTGEKS